MKRLRILTASEQVTDHLRHELLMGSWSEIMPGADRLATGLGIGIHTVAEALKQLEREGLLAGKGHRHRRRIVPTSQVANPHFPALRADALALSGASFQKQIPSSICGVGWKIVCD